MHAHALWCMCAAPQRLTRYKVEIGAAAGCAAGGHQNALVLSARHQAACNFTVCYGAPAVGTGALSLLPAEPIYKQLCS